MSKLAFVLGTVLLASAANAISWADSLKAVQKNVQKVIDDAILKVEEEFVVNQLETITVSTNLTDSTSEFSDKIWDDISSVTNNATSKISDLISNVEDVNIDACIKLSDRLGDVAKTAITTTSSCINSKLKIGFGYIDNINKVSNDVLVQLNEIKERAKECGNNVDSAKTAAAAIVCSKTAASDATWASIKSAPKLTDAWTKLKFLLVTLQVSLTNCENNNKLLNFHDQASSIVERMNKCIKQKIEESNPRTESPVPRTTNYPRTYPTTHPTTEPTTQATTYPTTHATTESTTKVTTYPTTQATTESTTKATTYPTTHATTESTTKATTYPTTHAITESTTKVTTYPTTQAITESTTKATTYPTTHATTESTTKATTYPTTHAITESTTKVTTYPTTHATTESTTKATTYPTTHATTEPTIKVTTYPTTHRNTYPKTHPTPYPKLHPTSPKTHESSEENVNETEFSFDHRK